MQIDRSKPVNIFEEVGGWPTFEKLVAGFYERVPNDDILGPMYPEDDMDGARDRLTWFLGQYWGGPQLFTAERGHPALRMRHARFQIDEAGAQRWLKLMGESLAEIDEETIAPAYRAIMWDHMEKVADMLINHNPAFRQG